MKKKKTKQTAPVTFELNIPEEVLQKDAEKQDREARQFLRSQKILLKSMFPEMTAADWSELNDKLKPNKEKR